MALSLAGQAGIPAPRWRVTVLIWNADDHMRNHGFLYAGTNGWSLSPAYDLSGADRAVACERMNTAFEHEDLALARNPTA